MQRTQELMGGPASPENHTNEPNFNMTKSMGFNDTAMQMAQSMEQFVPVPPIGARTGTHSLLVHFSTISEQIHAPLLRLREASADNAAV